MCQNRSDIERTSVPMAITAMNFNLGHAVKVASVIGTRVVMQTSVSLRREIIIWSSGGVWS
jgi:hypothetical protein